MSVSFDSTELLMQFPDTLQAAALHASKARTGLLKTKDKAKDRKSVAVAKANQCCP